MFHQLGVQELKDIEEAINWLLAAHPSVDAMRIGMSGHSYGGFMTSFALTHSKKFAAGIAGAPVTDWHDYDTIYTERYMDVPSRNRAGYEKTSVVKSADKLHGRLLLIHGLMDDNVHLQNSAQLILELQKADKPFELMVYPRSRHPILGLHYRRTWFDFASQSLGAQVTP
jgi:dipeptidyl-peptidase-4